MSIVTNIESFNPFKNQKKGEDAINGISGHFIFPERSLNAKHHYRNRKIITSISSLLMTLTNLRNQV